MKCWRFFLTLQAVLGTSNIHGIQQNIDAHEGIQSLSVDKKAILRRHSHDTDIAPTATALKNFSFDPKQDVPRGVRYREVSTATAAGRTALARCICLLAALVVISATARLAFVRQPVDEPLDILSAVLLCGAYVSISATSDILVKFETQANGGLLPFDPARMVFAVELLKLSLTLLLVLGRFTHHNLKWPSREDSAAAMRLMFVPALSYSINNAIVFFAVSRVDFSSLSVWRQMTPLFVAGIWVIIFKRHLGRQRWLALALLVSGTALNSFGGQTGGTALNSMVLVVLCSCLTTSVAGVANEYVLKRCGGVDIDFLCVLLYVQTSAISFFLALAMEGCRASKLTGIVPAIQGHTLLGGLPLFQHPIPIAIMCLQVLFGFAVARVIRYLGSVPRAIVNSLKELTVVVVAPAFTESHINGTVIVSAVIVGSAAALFTLAPSPLPMGKASKKPWSPFS